MRTLAALLFLTACGHKAADNSAKGDCAVVSKDPAGAMVALSKKYPGDPVKIAETIEKCIAPTGDDCERLAKIVQTIPSMMGTSTTLNKDSVLATCKGMPDEMRRCMLPSYQLGHGDECKKIYKQMITAVNVNPDVKNSPPRDCGVVALEITKSGVWLGATDGKGCFGKRSGSDLDTAWLEAALKPFVVDCRPSVEIAAAAAVAYRDLILVMDTSVKIGLIDVAVAKPDDLTHAPGADPETVPAQCEQVTATGKFKNPPAPQVDSPLPPPSGITDLTAQTPLPVKDSGALRKVPVIVITKSEILFADKSAGTVEELAKGTGVIDELTAELPPHPTDRRIVIQADEGTPSGLIARVIDTAKDAGYDNVVFAVRNK